MTMTQPLASILMVLENNAYPFDQRVRCQAETLVEAGYRVAIICPSDPGERGRDEVNGVAVYRFPPPPQGRGMLSYAGEYGYGTAAILAYAGYLMARQRFDILHGFGPPDTFFTVAALARRKGKQFVFDHRDLSPELYLSKFGGKRGLLYRVLVWMERACCRRADLLIVPNESYRDVDVTRHGIPRERFAIVRNGPKLEEFVSVSRDNVLRAKAGTILGYVGHMSSQDGVDYLFRSLHHLKHDLGKSDFFCCLIGPTDDPQGLSQLAKSLAIQDNVWFAGKMPFGGRLLGYLTAADICVEPAPSNPLNEKSTMTKIMEYMALGKPIVAYDLKENHVSADRAALYARPNDVTDFAEKIALLMDQPALRDEMGAFGRARVEAGLSWEYSARELLKGYRSLRKGRVALRIDRRAGAAVGADDPN